MTPTTRGVHSAALLLSAWAMGLELAHVLERAPKAQYPARRYARLQESLYVWFGNIGSVIWILAIVTAAGLAVLLRHDRSARRPVAAAAALEIIALAWFFAVVYPVNLRFPVGGPVTVPAGWAALRDRWEVGHAVGFALFTAAFVVLVGGFSSRVARSEEGS
jgi:hypothetical protein